MTDDRADSGPRQPGHAHEPRLGALATLPVFFKLRDKRSVVVGGSDAAAWKAELLASAGAQVDVYAPTHEARMAALAHDLPNLRIHSRAYREGDLVGAAIAIADLDGAEAAGFHAAARRAGVPVNVIDDPHWSDFQFGSIVERSPLIVAVSTDGGAPVFGQALRARLETLLPEGFRRWAQAAKDWRPKITALNLDFRRRRDFWERFTRLAFMRAEQAPTEAEFDALIAEGHAKEMSALGSVALVGAGPGDPELLTLRAVRALQSADVVLFDDLVLPGTLDFARREATKLAVGKRGYKPSCTQEDITALMISLAQQGKFVVRLKGGDPMIFGRAGEEIAALVAQGIAVEVVPGVTTASAAAATLRRSLTERGVARRVQFITAHAVGGRLPEDLDWRALADPAVTTAIYMGLKTLGPLSQRLIAEGLSPDTPATLVARVSWQDETHIVGTIADLPAKAADATLVGPCIVLVGRAIGRVL